MRKEILKKKKEAVKDIEPMKDELSYLGEEEPKSIENMKKRISKKF